MGRVPHTHGVSLLRMNAPETTTKKKPWSQSDSHPAPPVNYRFSADSDTILDEHLSQAEEPLTPPPPTLLSATALQS